MGKLTKDNGFRFLYVKNYASIYARQAVLGFDNLVNEQSISFGIYYVVLVDLSFTAKAAKGIGENENKKRVNEFIEFTKKSLKMFQPKNSNCRFLHHLGDASLLIFSNFEDIVQWSNYLTRLLEDYNNKCIEKKLSSDFKMSYKTCVHLMDITASYIESEFAVIIDFLSAIEEELNDKDFVITEAVRQALLQQILANRFKIKAIQDITLVGDDKITKLYKIHPEITS